VPSIIITGALQLMSIMTNLTKRVLTMSTLLSRLSTLKKANNENARQEMTEAQYEKCKAAIRAKNRGYNVQPNKFDVNKPYRVAINFTGVIEGIPESKTKWYNFGEFSNVHAAAAVGTIVSSAFFGDAAVIGDFDHEAAEASEEYQTWLQDVRNVAVIALANGERPAAVAAVADDDDEFVF
jgi:hypothetical protein